MGTASPVPPAVATRVAERIAEEWRTPATGIALEWGRMPAAPTLPPEAAFRLAGRGLDGRFIVVFDAETPAIAVRVRAGVEEEVPVATRALTAGSRLAAADIRSERRRHWGPPHTNSDACAAEGWRVRRPLAAGEPLTGASVAAPEWVGAGQAVALVWSRGGVSVSLLGTALHPAGAGETVHARVGGRARPVSGLMTAPGVATLAEGGAR